MEPGKLYIQNSISHGRSVYKQLELNEYGPCGVKQYVGTLEMGAIVLILETFDTKSGTLQYAHALTSDFGKVFIVIVPGWEV